MKRPSPVGPFFGPFVDRLPADLRAAVLAAALCWLGLAAAQPADLPSCPRLPGIEETVRQLNAARSHSAACSSAPAGGAVSPLHWDERLAASAQVYALELARRGQLSHDGLVHPRLRDRVRAAGYRFRLIGENLAAGPERLEDLLGGWLASPAHCVNLMEARFVDVGLACASGKGPGDADELFWVLHLGRGPEH